MTDPTPQTPAPAQANAAEVLEQYARLYRQVMNSYNAMSVHPNIGGPRPDTLERLEALRLQVLAAQPAPAPADAGLREGVEALRGQLQAAFAWRQGDLRNPEYPDAMRAFDEFARALLAQHPTPLAGAGAEAMVERMRGKLLKLMDDLTHPHPVQALRIRDQLQRIVSPPQVQAQHKKSGRVYTVLGSGKHQERGAWVGTVRYMDAEGKHYSRTRADFDESFWWLEPLAQAQAGEGEGAK